MEQTIGNQDVSLSHAPPPPIGVLYKVNSSKASFAELWRDSRSPSVILLWLTKLLGVRVPGSVNDPNVAALAPFEVAPETLAPQARQRIEAGAAELAASGFAGAVVSYYFIADVYNNSRTALGLLYRPDGKAIARVVFRTEGTGNPPKTHSFVEIISGYSDGSFLVSTAARAYLDPAPGVQVKSDLGAAPAKLWAGHEIAMRARTSAAGIVPINDPFKARACMERYHAVVRDSLLSRGVFQAMNESDLEQSARLSETYQTAQAQ